MWSAAGSAGIPAGALLGGVLTATLGWRWVFLVNVPAAALAALATRWVLPESSDRAAPRRLDLPGAVLATAGLASLVFAIVQADAHGTQAGGVAQRVLPPLAAAALLLAAFVAAERRARALLVPAAVLRTPGLVPANLVGGVLPVGLGALLFLATLYLQGVLGFNPLQTGLAYLALAQPVIAASPLASWLLARYGRRAVAAAGLLLQAGGLALLTRSPPTACSCPTSCPRSSSWESGHPSPSCPPPPRPWPPPDKPPDSPPASSTPPSRSATPSPWRPWPPLPRAAPPLCSTKD